MDKGDRLTPAVAGSGTSRSNRGLVISVAGVEISEQDSDGSFELPSVAGQVDVVLVFDRTGSMSDKIDGLTACLVELIEDLSTLDVDWRISCLPFGDESVPGDRIDADLPFVADRSTALSQLRDLPHFGGGNNGGESSARAMIAALGKKYRKSALKLLVLLTDEASHDPELTRSVAGRLRKAEVLCFVASEDQPYYRQWAEENGGQWYLISQSIDTDALKKIFREMVSKASTSVSQVLSLGWTRYRELGSGSGSDR
jgi:von Willebrand factor type A domain